MILNGFLKTSSYPEIFPIKKTAFSLIELVVVIGIISLIMGITTFYYFSFRSGASLRLEAKNISFTLNQARSLAITNQEDYKVVFNQSANKYVLKDHLDNPVTTERVLANGVRITSVSGFLDNTTVIFKPTGGLSTISGSIEITNSINKIIRLTVINTTGRIKIAYN